MMNNQHQEIKDGGFKSILEIKDGGFKSTVVADAGTTTHTTTKEVPCTLCGSSIIKKLSPSSGGDHLLRGYTKLQLPVACPNSSFPYLRRTVSEPLNSPETQFGVPPYAPVLGSRSSIRPTSLSSSSFLQNPPLHHFISDPAPFSYLETTTTDTFPLVPTSRASSQSPGFGEKSIRSESPSAKRLKRMEECIREMRTWWDQVIHEVEDNTTATHHEQQNLSENEIGEQALCIERKGVFTSEGEEMQGKLQNKMGQQVLCMERIGDQVTGEGEEDMRRNENGEAREEAVWVDIKGEFVVIHFKCPCGEGYGILLSGNDCYYRLI